MNIRQKCAGAIAASLLVSALLNIAVLRFAVFPSFIALERGSAESDVRRALSSIKAQADKLGLSVFVYLTWDDSHQFAKDGNTAYVTKT